MILEGSIILEATLIVMKECTYRWGWRVCMTLEESNLLYFEGVQYAKLLSEHYSITKL